MTLYIDPPKFIFVFLCWATILALSWKIASNTHQKMMISAVLVLFFLYNGIATSDVQVPSKYMYLFIAFSAAISAGMFFGLRLFRGLAPMFGGKVNGAFLRGRIRWWWKAVIGLYVFLHALMLVYPDFRLHLILFPPAPDIRSWFFATVDRPYSGAENLIRYIILLLTPIFYIALYGYSRKPIVIIVLLILIMYIKYVSQSYLDRGDMLMNFMIMFLATWYLAPRGYVRTVVLAGAFAAIPFILIFFHMYTQLRLGASGGTVDLYGALIEIANSEFSFLKATGMPLVESGSQVNLIRYITWIFTLPIPFFLKGGFDIALLNYEISEIVLSKALGSSGWYVVLPGLLAESIYIYGGIFFPIHAIMIGVISAMFCRICERSEVLSIMFFYIVIIMSYDLNRAGISSVMPAIVNGFMLFYIISAYILIGRNRGSSR